MNDRKIDSSIVVFYRRNESSDVVKAKLQNMQYKKNQLDFYKFQLHSFILVHCLRTLKEGQILNTSQEQLTKSSSNV